MQSTKARGSPKESPQKVSSRPVRQLKINPTENSSSSSANHAAARTPKNRSPKVMERKSPRSPISEKKRPSKLSELESQISQLQNDLKNVKDQLVISESSKRAAQEDAEQLKKKLADVSLKLEESQKQVSMLVGSKEANVAELQNISLEKNKEWETQNALECAHNEIHRLKQELEMKCGLSETITLIESMKIELKDSKESEARAKELVRETLGQLEAAKETVDGLRLDVDRSTEAYNSIASELEQSRERVNFLEDIVSKLDALELSQLESKLQATREAELESELKKVSADVEELKAKLMDKETELQGISEENESLSMKLEKSMLNEGDQELENELKELRKHVADMKANVMDKENEVQKLMEENKMLKLEIKNRETDKEVVAEVEKSRAAERDAMAKIEHMMDEMEKSERKATRVVEQLEAAQAANTEMEAELRRLKVQSDQWRKAAEAAASMLSPGSDGKCVERTGSMPVKNNYSPIGARLGSPFLDDFDDDSFKKKNGNVLKKIGVLWKKPQK